MSKLVYPKNGIYSYCRVPIENVRNNILHALNSSDLDVPYDFCYSNYLNSLESTIRNYLNEIDIINSKLKNVNNSFNDLEDALVNDVIKNLSNDVKIKDRDRMIV